VHSCLVHHRVSQIAFSQIGAAQIRLGKERPLQVRAQQVRVREENSIGLRVPQLHAVQTGSVDRLNLFIFYIHGWPRGK
jgi:hypothetical protein